MQSSTPKHTTKRLEWWGWFGAFSWGSFMMYAPELVLYQDVVFGFEIVGNDSLLFLIVCAIAILAFSFGFGKNPKGLSRVAFYTTPVAVVITAVFALMPYPFGSILYVLSPVFMAPVLVRRAFGVLYTASAGKQLVRYVSAFALSLVCYFVWLVCGLPKEVAFLLPALLTVLSWLGIRRAIALPNQPVALSALRFSKRSLVMFALVIALVFWLGTMNAVVYTHVVAAGIQASDTLLILCVLVLPGVGFLLYGVIGDKGYERAGLICAMMLFITGILISLLPGDAQAPWFVPLVFTNSLGGSYFEFLILTIPVFFLAHAKRPVFVASLGIVANLVYAVCLWSIEAWLPEMFRVIDVPLLFSAAISAIGFVLVLFFLFERHREKTLAAALYSLLCGKEGVEKRLDSELQTPGTKATPVTTAPVAATNEKQDMAALGLTQEEIEFALLLLEGKTRSEIARKLRLKAADTNNITKSIRIKINGSDSDPVITAAAKEYNLTFREAEILRCLRDGMTNPQIAAELIIAEETVKSHARNLMGKLPVSSRREIPSLLAEITQKAEN